MNTTVLPVGVNPENAQDNRWSNFDDDIDSIAWEVDDTPPCSCGTCFNCKEIAKIKAMGPLDEVEIKPGEQVDRHPESEFKPKKHARWCSCDGCKAHTRTVEAREREIEGYSCSKTAFLENGQNAFFTRLDCRGWGCDRCRVKHQIPKWTRHYEELVGRHDVFHLATVDPSDWPKLRRQIRRKGGNYIRVISEDRGDLVVATSAYRGSQEVSQAEAKGQLDFYFLNLRVMPPRKRIEASRGQVVTTSKDWQLRESRTDSDYRRIDFPRASDSTIRKVVAEYQCEIKTLQMDKTEKVTFAAIVPPPKYMGNLRELLEAMAEAIHDRVCPDGGYSPEWSSGSKGERGDIEPDDHFGSGNSPDPPPPNPGWDEI